jgi:coatomer protein complex subunit alpha (xenin)
MVIFKLERERPAYSLHGNLLFYVKERTLRRLDLTTSKDTGLLQLRGNARTPIHSISYNPAEPSTSSTRFQLTLIARKMVATENVQQV